MKVDVTQILKAIDGTPLKWDDALDLTLRKALTEALFANVPNEQIDGETKFKRYQLAQRASTADPVLELTPEDAAAIKQVVGKVFGVAVVGAVYTIFNAA